ncbi:MAG: type II toxin-antitoxin system HicB family antitoxin [Candidatus Vogelbacteria bacterium]|nr:type II toxin-antitoxin system HicB family antitoxin [Candidatus Vogelbacteria bacterium]
MRNIVQFRIIQEDGYYTASGMDLSIVTQGKTWDELVSNIREAVGLYLEDEDLISVGLSANPSILVSFEIPRTTKA